MNLYQLTCNYQALLHDISGCDEITEDQLELLREAEDNIQDKAINIAYMIKNWEAEAMGVEKAYYEIGERKKILKSKIEKFRKFLVINLQQAGITEIKQCPHFVIKLKKNPPGLDIPEEDKVPEEYMIVTKRADRDRIKKDIKDGKEINFAKLVSSIRVEIK